MGLLVACPMQSTERIKSLNIKSLDTVSERDATSTDFVGWWYPQAPKGAGCTAQNSVQLSPGANSSPALPNYLTALEDLWRLTRAPDKARS